MVLSVTSKILNKDYCSHIDCSIWQASSLGMQPIVQPICDYVRDTNTRSCLLWSQWVTAIGWVEGEVAYCRGLLGEIVCSDLGPQYGMMR